MFKEQRVTFETAKLLKGKVFNVGVHGCYTEYLVTQVDPEYPNGGGPFGMTAGEVTLDSDYMVNNHNGIDYSCKTYIRYAAPTQSLLQRWLREEHKIDIFLGKGGEDGSKYHAEDITKGGVIVIEDSEMFPTYEEALEKGLQEALKLI